MIELHKYIIFILILSLNSCSHYIEERCKEKQNYFYNGHCYSIIKADDLSKVQKPERVVYDGSTNDFHLFFIHYKGPLNILLPASFAVDKNELLVENERSPVNEKEYIVTNRKYYRKPKLINGKYIVQGDN